MNIQKFFMKNMYIILSILVIVVFFYFVTPPFFHSFSEGFTENEYKYLAPLPAGYTWSQDILTKLTEKGNKMAKEGEPPNTEENTKMFLKSWDITEEEAKYYIKNGKWPYDAYVLNYVKQNPDIMGKMKQEDGSPQTVSTLSKNWSNRIFYGQLIGPIESKQTPLPLSYQIFKGTIPAPVQKSQTDTSKTKTTKMISPITSSSLSSASTLSESNYNTLVGLCKNIIPV